MLPHGERIAEAVGTAVPPVVLIGHLTGVAAAVRCAHTRSGLAALVLISPVPGMWDDELPHVVAARVGRREGADRGHAGGHGPGSRVQVREHVAPGLLTDGEVVTQVLEFARRVV